MTGAGRSSLDFDAAPYIPILGSVACAIGQVDEAMFVSDPQAQAAALQQVGSALGATAVTVGWRSQPDVMLGAMRRITGRTLVALLSMPSPAVAREACEAGAAAIMLLDPPADASDSKYRQTSRAAAHYRVPVILVDSSRDDEDAVTFAAAAGLAGAVVQTATGDEPGIIGGGLAPAGMLEVPPRVDRFFWTFHGEVPASMAPEELAALGERLA